MNAIKSLLIICVFLSVMAWKVVGQSPSAAAQTVGSPVATVSPAASVSPSPADESDLEKSIKGKHKKHFHFHVGDHDEDAIDRVMDHGNNDVPDIAIPIIAIIFFSIFGAPVLIVAVILYFSMSRTRSLHKTVRMMVEKGQEVPAALLAPPPPAVRQRSDMRRGVVLMMVGIGLMVFFGACNDWEGGAWALGIIPFLIGAGYLLVWKFDDKKEIPPLPPAS
jgi:hypothetical protein